MSEKHPFWIRILPALLISGIVFAFSSVPGSDAKETVSVTIPHIQNLLLNLVLKKGAHLIIFFVLGQSYFFAFKEKSYKNRLIATLLAVLFAVSDELHQGTVLARNPSIIDIFIDSFGIWLGLFPFQTFLKIVRKR